MLSERRPQSSQLPDGRNDLEQSLPIWLSAQKTSMASGNLAIHMGSKPRVPGILRTQGFQSAVLHSPQI
jgi:hypothetical protein